MMDFLEHMNDIVRIVLPPGSNGDIRVFPVPADAPKNVTDDLADDADKLIRQTNLKFYRYERNMARRRAILSKLFDSMNRKQPFKLVDIYIRRSWMIQMIPVVGYLFRYSRSMGRFSSKHMHSEFNRIRKHYLNENA